MQGRGIQGLRSGYMVAVGIAVLTAGLPGCDDGASDPATQAEVMARWNQIPQATDTVDQFTFVWPSFDQFPHPTFKGGSALAYRHFAEILVAFYEARDNFDFLASKSFFRVRLRNVFPSGQVGIDTTFKELTEEMSVGSLGNISAETRQKLTMFAMRMR